jgi:hypothetical protein
MNIATKNMNKMNKKDSASGQIIIPVDAKVDLQTQRANTRNRYPKRASRFDLLIDKDKDTSTLALTTAIHPDVMAKRYSCGTRGSSKIALEQCNSPNR